MKYLKYIVAISFLVIITITQHKIEAQGFYFVDTTTLVGTVVPANRIGFYDQENCTVEYAANSWDLNYSDIAVHSNNKIYAFAYDLNTPGQQYMCRINFLPNFNANIILLTPYPQDSVMAMTCAEPGIIYAAGKGLSTYDVVTETFNYLGDLPPNMQAYGDLVYYKGLLYLTTKDNYLVEVDISNPSNSVIHMQFPQGIPIITGFTTYHIDCDSSVVYAMGGDGNGQKIYQVNFDNGNLTEICDTGLFIDGAAAAGECTIPECQVYIDLDIDDSTVTGIDYLADTVCSSNLPITDLDVLVDGDLPTIDSITIKLLNALDFGEERLNINTGNNNLSITGQGTECMVLANAGTASFSDFSQALSDVFYKNTLVNPTTGIREVSVLAWSDGSLSDTATAYLPIENRLVPPMSSIEDISCHGEKDGKINIMGIGGSFPYIYSWSNGISGDVITDIDKGIYYVTVSDSGGCEIIDTFEIDEPPLLSVEIDYSGPMVTCLNTQIMTAIGTGGTMPYSYIWNNGTEDSINNGIGAGLHEVTLSDSNGCTVNTALNILMGDTVLILETGKVCEGYGFDWRGNTYFSDTLVCEVYQTMDGCDSSICLSLVVEPLPSVFIDSDGNLCSQGEVILSTGNHVGYTWSTNEVTPEIVISTSGIYSVTISDGIGCTSEAEISISPSITFDLKYENPSCSGEENGWIMFENISGGMSPIQYSIDGGNHFFLDDIFEGLPAGGYNIIVEDAEGCQIEKYIMLDSPEPIVVDAGDDIVVGLGGTVFLNAFTNVDDPVITWSPSDYLECPSCLETTATPLHSIQYELEVMDSQGCVEKDLVNITVNNRSGIYVPNAFSPNGDGINDFFTIHSDVSITEVLSLKVFDRWGGIVFSKNNLRPNVVEDGWDGRAKGKLSHVGVYIYVAEMQRVDGEIEFISGEVALVR